MVTEIESVAEPYSILDYFRRKSISFVNVCFVHPTILAEFKLTCQYLQKESILKPAFERGGLFFTERPDNKTDEVNPTLT